MLIRAIYGDKYHGPEPYAFALGKALEGVDADVEAVSYPDSFDRRMLEGCDVLVLCKEGVVPGSEDIEDKWMALDDEQAIEAFVADGRTLFAWHSGLASYRKDGPLHAMYGGVFQGHPPQHEFLLKPGPTCPGGVTGGFTMTDELYRYTVTSDNADIWLEGHSSEAGVQPVGWTRKHGTGTLHAFTIAHETDNMMLPQTQDILRAIVTGV